MKEMLDNKNNNAENPFKVPENYFNDFKADLMNSIDAEIVSEPSKKVIPMWRKVAPWVASIAAVLVAVFTFVNFSDKTDGRNASPQEEYFVQTNISDEYYQFLESEVSEWEYDEVVFEEVEY